jgi:hypothetical protein
LHILFSKVFEEKILKKKEKKNTAALSGLC